MNTALTTLTARLAAKLDMGDGSGLVETLKATAFKGQVSDAQMTALMVVANQYGLNPWTKEIYAFPDRNNGIVPVVGVDGWSRIINEHPMFDGIDFEVNDEACTCTIYRKDRSHPIKVTEYMAECKRADTGPWKSHPRRMLRHKAMIQAARLAFGYTGIVDQDEAERIAESQQQRDEKVISGEVIPAAPTLPPYSAESMAANMGQWQLAVNKGTSTDRIIAMVSSRFALSDAQKEAIRDLRPAAPEVDPFVADMEAAEVSA